MSISPIPMEVVPIETMIVSDTLEDIAGKLQTAFVKGTPLHQINAYLTNKHSLLVSTEHSLGGLKNEKQYRGKEKLTFFTNTTAYTTDFNRHSARDGYSYVGNGRVVFHNMAIAHSTYYLQSLQFKYLNGKIVLMEIVLLCGD